MSLEMRTICEQCGRSLKPTSEAFICSYECTFCPECAETMRKICPNCRGELVSRPKRKERS
jgi:hypothetical protein